MPRVVVTREVAQGVWKELERQERPIEVADRHLVSERTEQRLRTAAVVSLLAHKRSPSPVGCLWLTRCYEGQQLI